LKLFFTYLAVRGFTTPDTTAMYRRYYRSGTAGSTRGADFDTATRVDL
jgi:hypothetical protein